MKTIILTSSIADSLYLFRRELIERLIKDDYRVVVVCAYSKLYIEWFLGSGCEYEEIKVNRHGKSPINDLLVFIQYIKIINKTKPDIILTYTIKPNIYASLACRLLKVAYINNITGLGVIEQKGIMQLLLTYMQRVAFKKSSCVFFQNEVNYSFYYNKRIIKNKTRLIPGSGVSLNRFNVVQYPIDNEIYKFLTIGRVRKDKGIEELFEAIHKNNDNRIIFHIIGPIEEDKYIKKIDEFVDDCKLIYHGALTNDEVKKIIAECHCLIHPSHQEGMANVILESAATARPVITTDISGCREAVDDGVSGYLFPCGDSKALDQCIKRFISLSWDKKRDMGLAGRNKMEREFDRYIVVNSYMEEIDKCIEI